jgi:hypothetical protein
LIGANNYGGTYTLSNGVLRTGYTAVESRDSTFTHVGGSHIATNGLSLYGFIKGPAQPFYARYELLSGNLVTSQLDLSTAGFNHTGGTNQVSGSVVFHAQYDGPSGYSLSSGTLLCSNITIGGGGRYESAGISQAGGTIIISNRLEIGEDSIYYEPAAYNLDAGVLQVNTLRIWPYGTFRVTGGSLISTGMVQLAGGRIEMLAPQAQFGPLDFSRTSYIAFASSPSVLRFANSRDSLLDFGILLVITNWSGSTNGGGYHQLIFGNSADAWTPGQLGDTLFRNPAGLPPGDYPARILANGEVVPISSPLLMVSRGTNSATLSWSGPYTLQTATNVAGPYLDLSNASSPYSVQANGERQRYFRLRR